MKRTAFLLQSNGWPITLVRAGASWRRRFRDHFTAKQLGTTGFRAGRAPRLLGLSHMEIGPDFHAADSLWLEAVLRYAGQTFEPMLKIGAHARLSDSVHIGCVRSIAIGDHLLCGSRVLISDHGHGRYGTEQGASDPLVPPAERQLFSAGEVRIGNNVWLGDGVVVLPGAHIGDGCVIGANSVVSGSIPVETIAVGAPARPIRRWDRESSTWQVLATPNADRRTLID